MKSVKDILKEMGFNLQSPETTQKAFLRHLINDLNQTNYGIVSSSSKTLDPIQNINQEQSTKVIVGEQLAFDFTSDSNQDQSQRVS